MPSPLSVMEPVTLEPLAVSDWVMSVPSSVTARVVPLIPPRSLYEMLTDYWAVVTVAPGLWMLIVGGGFSCVKLCVPLTVVPLAHVT